MRNKSYAVAKTANFQLSKTCQLTSNADSVRIDWRETELVLELLGLLVLCGSGLMTAAQLVLGQGNEEKTESFKKRADLVVAKLQEISLIPTTVSSWKKLDGTTGFATTMSESQR